MIKKFNEFIKEGLWSKTFDRARTGEQRLEDKSEIKNVCKIVSSIISEHLEIPYSDDICTCDGNEVKTLGGRVYQLKFKFKKWDFTYNVTVPEDPQDIAETMLVVSTAFSIGLKYNRELTKRVKWILQHVSDELKKIIRENNYIQ